MEFASGIPGTLGGALAMNAGAYDGEMKDIVLSVECMDMHGKRLSFDNKSLSFGYRKSILQTESLIAVSAKLKLKYGDPEIILKRMMELSKKRTDRQPLTYPSCGSTFKRPVGYFAN
jgi:UDP-N-acetylmuramate dehydrogenase